MIGTIVNTAAVITGGLLGILLKKKMPKRLTTIFFQVIGLFTLAIGISMAVEMKQIVIIVFSLVVGGLIGEWMNIERATERFADFLKVKLRIGSEQFSEGITTAFLLFCVGSMTIMGAIQEGTTGSPDLLFTKSLMDFFSSILLTSALGAGVIASAIPLFLFQGSITLLAKFAGSFFTPDIIMGLTSVGGILLIGLGINILEIKKLRIMNMLPALVFVVVFMWLF
ncbi:MAG: DUF554 domain-containing protein [Dysgonamonadaceae bacterium]|jgi:hypothetical protein|nr:DUF554 domain-containing protein [Dysgonamonadaceae bacterium]MDD4399194.1 DUF554 domain-containing protein [Dysgonamonadaceae bacterium]